MLRACRRSAVVFSVVLVSVLALTACGGGGGGGGGTGAAFNTTEFQAQYGLAQANALVAYGNNGNGNGITVGVVDSGIDLNHSEFAGRIAGASTDVITGVAANVQDTNGHGTGVAGMLAANRNSTGIHGIAFNSTILAVKATNNLVFADANLIAGINYAVANGARVLNLSLGNAIGVSAGVQNAIQAAVDAGVIVVAAAGNGDGAGVAVQSDFPARFANCTGQAGICNGFNARGRMIAVGAVNSANNEASFNSRAGDTASAYLVAAGVNVTTTAIGGGYASANGTSFSTPLVAGAVAIILQRFPMLTTQQAVNLLLTTATDLGVAGVDTQFGRGLLNLGAAFMAQGLSGLPTTGSSAGPTIPLVATSMKLGPAFGSALGGQAFLASAIVLDSYGRPFVVDLRNQVLGAGYSDGLQSFVAPGRRMVREEAMPGVGVQLTLRPESGVPARPADPASALRETRGEALESAVAEFTLGDGRIAVGFASQPADILLRHKGPSPFFGLEAAQSPALALVDAGDGGAMTLPTPAGTLTFGFVRAPRDDVSQTGGGSVAQVGWSQDIANGITARVTLGSLSEDEALFRSTGSGAFGRFADTRGSFLTAGLTAQLPFGLTGGFDYTEAQADAGAEGGTLLSNWSRVRANAMAATLVKPNLWAERDQFGISLSQPLRVHDAQADATLPVAYLMDGTIVHDTQRLSLSPTGRQTDLQVAYTRPWGPAVVGSFLRATMQPAHDEAAAPVYAGGVRLSLDF